MGAWDFGVWDNDTALDLKADFEQLRKQRLSVGEVIDRLLGGSYRDDDACTMMALAELCMTHGELPEAVFAQTRLVLHNGAEAQDWSDPDRRRVVCETFLEEMTTWFVEQSGADVPPKDKFLQDQALRRYLKETTQRDIAAQTFASSYPLYFLQTYGYSGAELTRLQDSGEIVGITLESNETVYPTWQWNDDYQLVSGIDRVIEAALERGIGALSLHWIMLRHHHSKPDALNLIQCLHSGDVQSVIDSIGAVSLEQS